MCLCLPRRSPSISPQSQPGGGAASLRTACSIKLSCIAGWCSLGRRRTTCTGPSRTTSSRRPGSRWRRSRTTSTPRIQEDLQEIEGSWGGPPRIQEAVRGQQAGACYLFDDISLRTSGNWIVYHLNQEPGSPSRQGSWTMASKQSPKCNTIVQGSDTPSVTRICASAVWGQLCLAAVKGLCIVECCW
jgi:hypothetical protein